MVFVLDKFRRKVIEYKNHKIWNLKRDELPFVTQSSHLKDLMLSLDIFLEHFLTIFICDYSLRNGLLHVLY